MGQDSKILLVENAVYMINFLTKILEKRYSIRIAKSIKNAVDILRSEEISLLLIDNHLAELNSYRGLEELMVQFSNLPVLLISTRLEQQEIGNRISRKNSLHFVDKPAQQNQIIYCIKKAIAAQDELNRKGEQNKKTETPASQPNSEPSSGLPPSILLIEDDKFIVNMIVNALQDVGIGKVDAFEDGELGYQAAQNYKYDMIILDWMVPTLSGLALFNRLKSHEFYELCPMLVVSGFIGKKDFTILADFPLCDTFEKPFTTGSLLVKIKALYKESVWYASQEEKLYEFFDKLKEKQIEDAATILKFVGAAPNPYPLAVMAGRILRQHRNFDAAEQLLKFALKNKENMLAGLNELGKLYLSSGKNKEAKAVLKKALEISPQNLQRLCNLGDLSLQEMDVHSANEYFKKALAIDKNDPRSLSGKKVANNIAEWVQTADTIPQTYAGLLNAIGISLVRSGNFEQGIEHYKSAMMHIEDDISKAKLSFNLGLGYTRWKQPDKALPWFKKSLELDGKHEKAQKYVRKMEPQTAEPEIPSDDDFALASIDDIMTEKESEDDFLLMDEEQDSYSTSAPGDEVPNEKKYVESDDPLKRACTRIDQFFDFLTRSGIYVQGQIPLLRKLLSEYGPVAFSQAINAAIDGQITSVLQISNMLSQRYKKKNDLLTLP